MGASWFGGSDLSFGDEAMRINWHGIVQGMVMTGIGVYAYKLIEKNTEPGSVARWVTVSIPALVGVFTPAAIELVDQFDGETGPEDR